MIIVCPQCASISQASRDCVAWVICPRASCGHQFLAWPPGSAVDDEAEFRERRFKCAVHDKPFYVVFGRKAKVERFQVLKVHGEQGWLANAVLQRLRGETPKTVKGSNGHAGALIVPVAGALTVAGPAPSFRQMLGRVLATPPAVTERLTARWQRPTAEQMLAVLHAKPGDTDDLDFGDVDLDGWYCLHCGYEALLGPHFAHCAPRCGELVCLGRSEKRPKGVYFRCCKSCGGEGQTHEAPIPVGGEKFAAPQAAGRAGLIGNVAPGVLPPAAPSPRLLR